VEDGGAVRHEHMFAWKCPSLKDSIEPLQPVLTFAPQTGHVYGRLAASSRRTA
jgi:hypothetical protein